jgi:hypothetical protein
MRSSAGFDPSSRMVAGSLTSNSLALAMMKQIFSVEIDRVGASGACWRLNPLPLPMSGRPRHRVALFRCLLSFLVDCGFRQFGQRFVGLLFFLQRLIEQPYGIVQAELSRPGL